MVKNVYLLKILNVFDHQDRSSSEYKTALKNWGRFCLIAFLKIMFLLNFIEL